MAERGKGLVTGFGAILLVLIVVALFTGRGMRGMGMMMGGTMMGGGMIGLLFMLLFWALLIALLVTLFMWMIGQSQRR